MTDFSACSRVRSFSFDKLAIMVWSGRATASKHAQWHAGAYGNERIMGMAFIPDLAAFKKSLTSLPVSIFEPGETVLAAGSTTGQLFILRQGLVEVVRDGTQIATVS